MKSVNPYLNFNGNTEDVEELFNKLSDDGNVMMPPTEPKWENIRLANGDVVEEVNKLKKSRYGGSKEIMVYGGHSFVSSCSDCPTCPVCEEKRKPKSGFLSLLGAPARRALENKRMALKQQKC